MLTIVPISIRDAKAFVRAHHRHAPVVVGARLAIGLEHDGVLVGVGMLGRPVARGLDADRLCGEAVRVCVITDAPKGASSKIIARLKRIWQLMGGARFVSYNREDESGASMRGAGLTPTASVLGRQWSCTSRPRAFAPEVIDKTRWEQSLERIPA
jgi:hypothetical protein